MARRKLVTVLAALATTTAVAWGEDPSLPLPENRTLRPDLEALPLEVEAALAAEITSRTGQDAGYAELERRLDESERTSDPFRLKTVRYLHRDPLRLPGATKALGRSLAGARELGRTCDTAATWADASAAPILTTQAPSAPPSHSPVEAHVEYCLALMHRSRDLVEMALGRLTADERKFLEKTLPRMATRFKEDTLVFSDTEDDGFKRHERATALAAKVDRTALVQALAELAPLARAKYLDQLASDLGSAPGSVLYEGTCDLGAVVVGGSKDNTYDKEYALIIDIGGNDRYIGPVAAARGRAHPVAVSIDLAGDDRYESDEPFSQGAALMGVGLLVDRKGNDHYTARAGFAQGAALCGAAALVDLAGDDTYTGEAYAQGSVLLQGLALLLDSSGKDAYEAGLYAQGFGGPGGLGALVDLAGNDRYVVKGLRPDGYGDSGPGIWDGFSQGCGCGFRRKASGGIGVLVDAGGDDSYEGGNFSQGGGYYYGWGALCDLGHGKDRYDGSRYAQAFAAHQSVGSLWDEGGNDHYSSRSVAAQGIAWDLSVVAFMDESGDDIYESHGTALGASAHNGFALFYDGAGKDTYRGPPLPARPDRTITTAGPASRSSSTRAGLRTCTTAWRRRPSHRGGGSSRPTGRASSPTCP